MVETARNGAVADEVLRLENVTLRFDALTALDRVSFMLRRGETCVIQGAAGSGKTVLLKIALGLIKADEGRVFVFGRDMTGAPEREWMEARARMGILFQEGGLFDSMTIEENVGYPLENIKAAQCPPDEVRPRVEQALQFVELGHTLEKVPSELSGGMRRRVGIARAVVTRPQLVLYDSPTAGLDPITATTIMALVAKERDTRQTATALATHRYQDGHLLANYVWDPARAELAPAKGDCSAARTRFVVMGEGRIVFEGSQQELEDSTDEYISQFARRWKE
ncbi:MAG TPA: ATP-binding cassette domain-containing protein [Bryobacteraceae bacterium]|jgi:phospholipid/cholesterol/gamma-HCH transport system ATP-binding protein|nr:ATP-binding cassette domain-containing protein [Bryobacteraceae bacterium]